MAQSTKNSIANIQFFQDWINTNISLDEGEYISKRILFEIFYDDYKRQELEYGKNHKPEHFVDEEDGEIITVWVAF